MSKLVKIEYIIFLLMTEPPIHDILSKNFSTPGKEDWLRVASSEIPKNISLENLWWNVDGLTFSPYYEKADLKGTEYLQSFHYRSHRMLSASWFNMPDISVIDEQVANEKALTFLQRGADGIVFDLAILSDPDVDTLLKGMDWNNYRISFRVHDTKDVTKILTYADEKFDSHKLTGAFWWNTLSGTDQFTGSVKQFTSGCEKYHLLGIDVPATSPVKEISHALVQGVRLMDGLTDSGVDGNTAFHTLSLCFACDENFLVNVAKLKAIRMLWYQLSQSFKISDYTPADLQIRCQTRKQVGEKYEPHGNMIKNTCEALSAIIGGCNEIGVAGGNEDDSMTDRVALNVSNILSAEAHLDKVADPLAGSYAIEMMVNDFSQAAWREFQKLQS